MKALVTGGRGFLGGRIARMLHDQGHEVIALGRSRYPQLEQAGMATVQADVRDGPALSSAFQGVEVVFHAAACVGIWGRRRTFWEVNVEGTRNVIEACRRCGVSKLVFTSSPSVVFGDQELCGVDESQPYPRRFLADYPETKAVAERLVLAANRDDLLTVAIRPHLVWGPGDPHLIPRVIEQARQGRLTRIGDGSNLVDVTYIDNAAEAHLLAAQALWPGAPSAGRAYFITQGEPVCLWPWLDAILARVGAPPVRRAVSFGTARRAGWLLEGIWRLLGLQSEPRVTRFLASQLAWSHYFDISAARRDLGYAPRVSTSEGLERLFAWLPDNVAGGSGGYKAGPRSEAQPDGGGVPLSGKLG